MTPGYLDTLRQRVWYLVDREGVLVATVRKRTIDEAQQSFLNQLPPKDFERGHMIYDEYPPGLKE